MADHQTQLNEEQSTTDIDHVQGLNLKVETLHMDKLSANEIYYFIYVWELR
jgi:hypothetical protein